LRITRMIDGAELRDESVFYETRRCYQRLYLLVLGHRKGDTGALCRIRDKIIQVEVPQCKSIVSV
jgi:hypothetical protein